MDATPHWSYSALNTYLQCPMKYAFRYIEHAPEERSGACFAFGRAFHAVLSERAIRGSEFTLDDAKENFFAVFKAETEAAGPALTYKPDETFDGCVAKAGDMLSVALENWQDDYTVKSVAESFSVTIPGVERPLIGEFDLVVEEGDKEPCIVDWKTSGSRWPAGKADFERQATAYCYAYRAKYQHTPLFRYDVYTKAKVPQVGNWYTVRTGDELTRFAELCRQVERCVNAEAFYRNESQMNCGDCPYRDRCRKGGVK
ncbi:MAG: PD-(D/E)XK nuclease family protein [Lentisphaeria bacterium]|nr:PD-(D/E)XK nuclease family protein [Lentisphaeria bacterium]